MLIAIDGALGEGGGQILRTSLSLSLVTGKPVRIANIRAGRQKPGLLRQHLAAVLAAAEVSGAAVEGAVLGSTCLTFSPGIVRSGDYSFAVGTAGSGTLVFQTVLPALMLTEGKSTLIVEGGTHNDAAPPYDFLAHTFVPLVERMGPQIQLDFERYGFYPAGGGSFRARIQPVRALTPLHIGSRSCITSRRVIAVVANLAHHIAQREVETACKILAWEPECQFTKPTRHSTGPGNVVMVEIASRDDAGVPITEFFTAFGQPAVSAEKVASLAADQAAAYLASRAMACEHLTDQLLLPMALAGAGSFTATNLNLHGRTNMDVISRFLPVRFETAEREGLTEVRIVSASVAKEMATQTPILR